MSVSQIYSKITETYCDGPTNGPLDQERETKRSTRQKGMRDLGQEYDDTGALHMWGSSSRPSE